jgi:hypothetical protein
MKIITTVERHIKIPHHSKEGLVETAQASSSSLLP